MPVSKQLPKPQTFLDSTNKGYKDKRDDARKARGAPKASRGSGCKKDPLDRGISKSDPLRPSY